MKNPFVHKKVSRPEPASSAAAVPEAHARSGIFDQGLMLTGQRIFGAVCLMLVLMPLVYMGGVLAGRAQVEREISARDPMATVRQGQEDRAQAARAARAAGDETEKVSDAILKPTELTFSRMLRAAPGEKPADPMQMRPFKPVEVPAPAQKQDGQAGEAQAAGTAGAAEAAVESDGRPVIYDFVFQVATFQSEAKGEEMRMRLEEEGFRSRMEVSGGMVIVYLLTRGPIERVQEVREVLGRLRAGEPIERRRKPVQR